MTFIWGSNELPWYALLRLFQVLYARNTLDAVLGLFQEVFRLKLREPSFLSMGSLWKRLKGAPCRDPKPLKLAGITEHLFFESMLDKEVSLLHGPLQEVLIHRLLHLKFDHTFANARHDFRL